MIQEENIATNKNVSINPAYEDLEEYKLYKETKDIKIRNKLIQKNQGLVNFVIGKFYSRTRYSKYKEDLKQEGTMALFDALEGFDPSLGFKFSTYATWWIRQYCNNFLNDKVPEIHVPSHVRATFLKAARISKEKNISFKEALESITDAEPGLESLAIRVKAALKTGNLHSLNSYITEDTTLEETLVDKTTTAWTEYLSIGYTDDIKEAVKKSFKNLKPKYKLMILERFNLLETEEMKSMISKYKQELSRKELKNAK